MASNFQQRQCSFFETLCEARASAWSSWARSLSMCELVHVERGEALRRGTGGRTRKRRQLVNDMIAVVRSAPADDDMHASRST